MQFRLWDKFGLGGEWSAAREVSAKSKEAAAETFCTENGYGRPASYTNDTYRVQETRNGRVFYRYIRVERIKQ